MIGIDITSIKRFEDKKENFVKKILSSEEYELWKKSDNKNLFIAQRWSIKEALFKADNNLHDYHKINIKRDPKGFFVFDNFIISTSKEDDYVIAFVIKKNN